MVVRWGDGNQKDIFACVKASSIGNVEGFATGSRAYYNERFGWKVWSDTAQYSLRLRRDIVLGVSPRTVYADMDKAESWLCNLGLQLIRKPHFGAKVQGAELQVRQACFTLITTIGQRSHSSMSIMHPEDLIQSFHEQTDGFLFETLIDASDIEQVMAALATCKDTPQRRNFLGQICRCTWPCK